MIVCVVGGRSYEWNEHDENDAVLAALFAYLGATEVWTGGATGVDEHATRLAKSRGLSVRTFLPEPDLFGHDFAPLRRNEQMMDELDAVVHVDGRQGCVVAFPGEDGTDNAVRQALRRRLNVIDLRPRLARRHR
jgi:predicted Rossmann-fold nucleotide-binding protein